MKKPQTAGSWPCLHRVYIKTSTCKVYKGTSKAPDSLILCLGAEQCALPNTICLHLTVMLPDTSYMVKWPRCLGIKYYNSFAIQIHYSTPLTPPLFSWLDVVLVKIQILILVMKAVCIGHTLNDDCITKF